LLYARSSITKSFILTGCSAFAMARKKEDTGGQPDVAATTTTAASIACPVKFVYIYHREDPHKTKRAVPFNRVKT